jgi:hypothetical protein
VHTLEEDLAEEIHHKVALLQEILVAVELVEEMFLMPMDKPILVAAEKVKHLQAPVPLIMEQVDLE